MKILDFLSMVHRICKRYSNAIVGLVYAALLIVLVAFIFSRCSRSSFSLSPEEIYLRGAEDISRDFDDHFNRVLGTKDSICLIGYRLWKHSNMTERVSR